MPPIVAIILGFLAAAAALILAVLPGAGPSDALEGPAHALAFATISFFFAASLPHRPWGGLSFALLLGLMIEGAQMLVPARTASLEDMIANLVGVAIGGLAYLTLRWLGSILRR